MKNENISNAGQVSLADTSDVVPLVTPNISQGIPDMVNEPVPSAPIPDKGPETPVEGQMTPEGGETTPKPEDAPEAIVERLKLQNAQNAKLLSALGIDPLSDLAEQLEQGLITPEMLKAHVAAKYGPQAAQPTAPVADSLDAVAIAEQEQKAALEAYNKEIQEQGGLSLVTNQRLRDADNRLNDAKLERLTNQISAEKQTQQVNESVEAVLSVARSVPEYAGMSKDLQGTLEQTSLSLTGLIADQESKAQGIDPSTLTPSQYNYFAGKAQNMLGQLAEHFRNLGREEAKASFRPTTPTPLNNNVNTPTPMPVPVDNSGPSVPLINEFAEKIRS
jgi:hypothetical protein